MTGIDAHRRRLSRRLRARAGYTLLEILIVLAIIGLLVALVGTQYNRIFDGAKVNTARTELRTLKSALDIMQLDIGRYPSATEGLGLLVTAPGGDTAGWNGPYIDEVPTDPWNNAYVYAEPGDDGKPTLTSLGNNGEPEGEGNAADIVVH